MAFNFQALMDDPKTMIALQLLGGANQRNAPLIGVANSLQSMRKQKVQEEQWKAQQEHQKAQMDLYAQQIAVSKQKAEQEARTNEHNNKMMELAMQSPGVRAMLGDMGQPQPQPQPETPQLPGMTAPILQQPNQPLMQPQSQPVSQPQIQQQPLPPMQAPSLFRSKIIPQESGGQQFRPDGSTLISPKGAVGIAQVMPTTGPEAAALAGLPWDLNRLHKDPEYNAALGEAYFNKQLKDFGRPDYAAAAYNAGPGATQKALDVAAKTGKPELWTAFLPKETQDYVKRTTGTPPPQPATPPPPPKSPLGLRNPGAPLMVLGALAKGPEGLLELGKSMEPKAYTPGQILIDSQGNQNQLPDPKGDTAAALAEKKFKLDESVEGRLTAKDKREVTAKKATDFAAYDNVNSSAVSMHQLAQKLLDNKSGTAKIFGKTGGWISPRILGDDAMRAAADLETLKAKAINDTLQAIRQASENGASGYGQLDRTEGENLGRLIAPLERAMNVKDLWASLTKIQEHTEALQKRSKNYYETVHGKLPSQLVDQLPPGYVYLKTENGKKVFHKPNDPAAKPLIED